jgi:LPS O-antigen subunit length determinant protein (WzzB/FepE family)
MKKNNSYLLDDEVDLREILKKLWKEKILVFFISAVFMVIGYIYAVAQPKYYKSEFTIRNANSLAFEAYISFIEKKYKNQKISDFQKTIVEDFNNELKFNLLSIDLLLLFIEKNNEINDFKFYLKEKNIGVKEYFHEKIKLENNNNKYSFTYSKLLAGEAFLNDYIIFVNEYTQTIFKKKIEQLIISEINFYKENLEIAEKIGLEYPFFKSTSEIGNKIFQSEILFYQGTIALSQQLVYLNRNLDQSKNLSIDYNNILLSGISTSRVSVSTEVYVILAFLIGLFFSMILLFLRTEFNKN